MCLAIPGKIITKFEDNGLPMGKIDFSGTQNTACLSYTPEAEIGDFVIVHAGFALQILNEEEAAATLKELARLADIMASDTELSPGLDKDQS
jgi:hydrogenase expression/formation protein HypC